MTETPISEDFVLTDKTKSWLATEYPQHPALPYVGDIKGVLKLVSPSIKRKKGTGIICKCECGKYLWVPFYDWLNSRKKSCGCARDRLAGQSIRKIKSEDKPTYLIWLRMKNRCRKDPTLEWFKWYGAKGIDVCDRWKVFSNFLADMGQRPTGKSLDRIDSSKGYFPENCRWATKREQSQNRPGFVNIVTYDGKSMTEAEWDREKGFKPRTVGNRLRLGWSVHRALNEPIKFNPRWHNGSAN